MALAVKWMLAMLTPALVALAVAHLERLVDWVKHVACRREPLPPRPPIEKLAADLRRLHHKGLRYDAAPTPGRALRRQGLAIAYDDALIQACQALSVPGAEELPRLRGRAHDVRILELEHALRQRGLDVRDPMAWR